MNVKKMEQRFNELKEQREAGKIGDEQFAAEVKKLQFRDKRGQLWRISSTGQWYYEQGGRWMRGEPPRESKILSKATVVVLLLAVGIFALIAASIWAGHEVILGFVTPSTDTPCPTATFTQKPTVELTEEPTSEPTEEPTEPNEEPTEEPTAEPTEEPTSEPNEEPTEEPTMEPTEEPTSEPNEEPTEEPTMEPTEEPTSEPNEEPTEEPTMEPTNTPTPTPTGKIAFPVFDPKRETYDIFIANADGTGQKKIIKEEASQPCFNPEGTWIAYRSWRSDKRGLFVADTSSGNDRWTITTLSEASRPSVSEGGIVYYFRQAHIYLLRSQEEPRVIRWGGQLQPLLGESPTWVSSRKRLVFKSCMKATCGLYLTEGVNDGTGITRITYDYHISDTNPEASPDGKKVAFMSRRDENWEIYVVDLDTRKVERLTDNAANDGLPIWSPEGRTIAFASDRSGEWAVWAMNPDGSNQRVLFPLGGSLRGYDCDAPLNERGGWEEERLSWSR